MSKPRRMNTKRLTEQWLESKGAIHWPMEFRIPTTFITKDGFGFVDLVALKDGVTYGIQYCDGTNAAARVAKILASPLFPIVARHWTVLVVAWREVAAAFGPPSFEPRIIHVLPAE